MFADIANVMPGQATDYWKKLPLEFGCPLILLAVLGAVTMLIRRMRVGFLLIIGLAIQLFYMFNYEIWDLYVFYIPSYVLLSILSIAGMGTVIDLGMVALRPLVPIVQIRWMNLTLESAAGLLVLGFALWPVFQPQKESVIAGEVPFEFDEYPVYDESLLEIVRATVLELPEHAVVFTDWDMVWPYYYAAHIIEGRTDLTFIETYPADDLEGVADSVINYVIHHQENTPIFFSERESSLLKAGYAFTPARIGPTRLLRVIDD
jgi:hypothetical protein